MAKERRLASLGAGTFVDALPIPVDGNFTWDECRVEMFEYKKKDGTVVATTVAARVNFKSEEGEEFIQHYSIGDPSRVMPSSDGKSIVLVGDGQALNKSSNFFVLMKALEDAGLPEGFLENDFSVLEGMVTHNIGVPEPKRTGLERATPAEGAPARVRTLAVPDEIIKMPGKSKAAAKKAGAGAEDLIPELMAVIGELVAENEEGVTRKEVASAAIKAKKAPVATLAFKATEEQLGEYGYALVDDKIISVA